MDSDDADKPITSDFAGVRHDFRPEDFTNHTVIGRGKDSTIYSATCSKLKNQQVAIKMYNKAKLSPSKMRAIKREAAMMIYMTRKRVPLITTFLAAFQDSKQIYIVMEHCAGGDLLEQLLKEGRAMTEQRVALEVALPILTSLSHIHQLRIIHRLTDERKCRNTKLEKVFISGDGGVKLGGYRVPVVCFAHCSRLKNECKCRDIKLENIFIGSDGRVKLGDFGLTMSMKQEVAISPVGTVEYMAPEVVELPPVELVSNGTIAAQDIKACDEKVDIWALGVTLFELLTGQLPFEGADKPAIKAAILRGNMKPLPANLKPECVSFMSLMLARDPRDRASAHELLQHPFIRMYAVPARAHSGSLPTSKPSMSRGGSRETTVAELKGVNRKSSSNASQGATAQTLPLSFSLRHNELADPTIPERMVLKVEACSHDSTDSLIRAQHAALLEYGDSMSSSNSMTCPTLSQSQDSPRNSTSFARGKSKSPLQLETRSCSASQMRSMNANRRVEEIASPNFLKKVAVISKTMLTKPTLDDEASATAS